MRIALTFALSSEFEFWRRRSVFSRIEGSGAPIYKVSHDRDEIYVLVTGVGTRGLAGELRRLLTMPVDLCIASGLTGSLRKEHPAGTVLVAKAVKGEADGVAIQSDTGLVNASVHCGATVVDCFYTANAVVSSQSEKRRLSGTADAVDMESFHVMTEARRASVPAVALRAVSDSAETSLPVDFDRVLGRGGSIIWTAMFLQLIKSPSQIVPFVHFALDSFKASRNLSLFLRRYVNTVSSGGHFTPAGNRMVR